MLITLEPEVLQRWDASQNDHKSKGYPSKTSEAAFTMQKADKGNLAPCAAAFEIEFQKCDFPALVHLVLPKKHANFERFTKHQLLILCFDPLNHLPK